jgi:hypothetical protein
VRGKLLDFRPPGCVLYDMPDRFGRDARSPHTPESVNSSKDESVFDVCGGNPVFTVDFSKREYTLGKVSAELDDYTIYVYPPPMIASEKLRAICQQIEDYAPTGRTKHPRARDFFDIYVIVTETGFRFDSPESHDLVRAIFAAKEVPLSLLAKIAEQRNFHRDDWPSVRATVADQLEEFDYYFDFVLHEIEPLQSLGME